MRDLWDVTLVRGLSSDIHIQHSQAKAFLYTQLQMRNPAIISVGLRILFYVLQHINSIYRYALMFIIMLYSRYKNNTPESNTATAHVGIVIRDVVQFLFFF